jgi:hypothetical protein
MSGDMLLRYTERGLITKSFDGIFEKKQEADI